jgi:Zn-dependent protease with chaperone function
MAPDAVAAWDQANADRLARRSLAARDGYVLVIAQAPTFDHAYRRLCGVESERARALRACRKALQLSTRWENHAALAQELMADKDAIAEATTEARAAAAAKPSDPSVLALQCELALRTGDAAGFQAHYGRLSSVAPNNPETLQLAVFEALVRGDTAGARAALARVKAQGAVPPEGQAQLEKMIDAVEDAWTPARIAKTFGLAVAAWLGTILALFAIGTLLSRATLRHTDAEADARDGAAVGGTRTLKRLYRAVITVAGVVYWISLPFVVALVVAGLGAAVYGCLAIGRIPIKLLLILLLVAASSVWALLKSVAITLRRPDDADPGESLALDRHPRLSALLAQVSARVGTRTVDKVFLTAGTDMAVYERGGALAAARGHAERCLVVGAGVLRGLPVGALKGVLAHEFGHFKNEDTAGGALSLAVRRSMIHMILSLARGGAAAWYNPAWIFATRYHRVFLRISQGASRLQEVLADRWAVAAYGSEPFVAGFEHVIRRSVEHDAHLQRTLEEVTSKNYALANLFTYVPETPPDPEANAKAVAEALARDADEFDSHPPPRRRIALARALGVVHPPAPDDALDAWQLLEDGDALEARLTDRVCDTIAREHAVTIRRAA